MSHSGCALYQGILSTPIPFVPWQLGLPFPIQFDLENSRSKAKVKDTPVSTACWLISLVFHIRASYRLPSPSFHDNRASHSRDAIWPWKFKVKGQGQRYPSQRSVKLTHFLSVSHQGILSTPIPFVPRQSGLPFPNYNLTLKIQGQRYPSQRSIQLTHFLDVSHQGILWTPVPFVPWQSGLPFLRYNLTLKIQGQGSRSKG